MKEEYHGNGANGIATTQWKMKYNWNSLTANVWLPSVSELVGITGEQHGAYGTYYSAMQGMNTSDHYYADAQGGTQFAYFQQYNASGGGEKIWNACGEEVTWLRSSYYTSVPDVWRTGVTSFGGNYAAVNAFAVHPAGLDARIACHPIAAAYCLFSCSGA